jgi:hypothetical protein
MALSDNATVIDRTSRKVLGRSMSRFTIGVATKS